MSEVQARPAASRGRGAGRGGRGGFGNRGGRTSGRTNGEKENHRSDPVETAAAFEDDGDLAELRKLHGGKVNVIKEMFPAWSEADVLFALQETDGDENVTVTRIAEGKLFFFFLISLSCSLPLLSAQTWHRPRHEPPSCNPTINSIH
jgi:hypothetical protein